MMARIEPEAVYDAFETMMERCEKTISNHPFGNRAECLVAKVQGGFGDGLMAMSKLKTLTRDGVRTVVMIVPDGGGDTENARRCCEMFSFVDEVIPIGEDSVHSPGDAARLLGGGVRVSFVDLRFGNIFSIEGDFSTIEMSDLKDIPDLPGWLPRGNVCCLQPSTKQNIGKDAMWDGYEEAMRIIEDEIGIPVILIGGPTDVERVVAEPNLGVNAVGRLSFEESFVLCARSMSIAVDSWTAHCSGVFGKPSIYIGQENTLKEFFRFVEQYGGINMMLKDVSPRSVAEMVKNEIGRIGENGV